MSKIKTIGILTSGGDAPGMNAAIRAVTRAGIYNGFNIKGIYRGYDGLIKGEVKSFTTENVSGIITRGGTILKTARSKEFMTPEGMQKAYETCQKEEIDALIVIGGNGSLTGARNFGMEFDFPCIGLPGTIDNDLYGTDNTIGYDTTMNTIMECVDRIRDTANSHERIFFVEVMGRDAGFLAQNCAIACGAEAAIVPEEVTDVDQLAQFMGRGIRKSKKSCIVIVSESPKCGALYYADRVKKEFPEFDVRVSILGHLQRGGTPSARDRILASITGVGAIEAIKQGQRNVMVGVRNNEVVYVPFSECIRTDKRFDKRVLTGGPCAGKTTALVKITEYFSGFGYKVFNVPEVPTIYSTAGWNYLTPNRDLYYQGELAILETQLALENQFIKLAEVCHKPVLVVCDRGTLDISAYIKPEEWEEITAMAGTNSNELRERYDAVLHLVSAADGAEQYYTTATNATRYEQANEEGLRIARELDKKVIKAWTGHPHLRVINNHNDFENKLNRVLNEIAKVVGLPQPVQEERIFRVEICGEIPECSESEITQTYLVAEPGCEVRLRRREWSGGKVVNVHRSKKRISDTEVIETERQVDNNLYEQMLQQADPYRATIKKKRQSFIWKGQFFEIDTFHSPVNDLVMMETKGVTEKETVNFPPFIKVIEDVTGNSKYLNYNIALNR